MHQTYYYFFLFLGSVAETMEAVDKRLSKKTIIVLEWSCVKVGGQNYLYSLFILYFCPWTFAWLRAAYP